MSDNEREFEQLPEWLKDCWELAPAIARKAEKYIEGLKALSSDAVLGEVVKALIDTNELLDELYVSYGASGIIERIELNDEIIKINLESLKSKTKS